METVSVPREDMEKAAGLLRKLAKENSRLRQEKEELQNRVEEKEKQAKAEKIASAMVERGMIEEDRGHEKVAQLMDENLDAYEIAMNLNVDPQNFGLGKLDTEKTAAAEEETADPMVAALQKHMGF